MKGKKWTVLLICAICYSGAPTYAAELENEVQRPVQSAEAVDQERAERYYQLGLSLLEQEKYRRAYSAFQEAIRANWLDARAYLESGKLSQKTVNGLKAHYEAMFGVILHTGVYDIAAEEYYVYTPEMAREKMERRDGTFETIEKVPLDFKEYSDASLRSYGQALALGVSDVRMAEIFRLRGGIYRIRAEFDAMILRMEKEDNNMFRLLDLLKPEERENRGRWRRQDAALVQSAAAEVNGNFAKALSEYGEALRLNPADVEAYAGRAEVYYQRGRYRLAAAGAPGGFWAERTVRRAKPEGTEQFDLGDYRLAMADYERALSMEPERTEFLFKLGKISKSAYDDAQAFAYYSRAAEDPRVRVDALYERANLHVSLEQGGEAQKDLSVYLDTHKDMSYAVKVYYGIDVFKNKMEGILETTDKITAEPNNGALYQERAAQLVAIRKFSQAADDYTRAAERGVRTADLYWQRGECYRKLALWQQALADYERAEASGYPSDLPEEAAKTFYHSRAMARASLKQFPAAANDYAQALQRGAEDVALYFERSECYKEMGLYHLAAADLLQALLHNTDTKDTKDAKRRGLQKKRAVHAYWKLSELYADYLRDEDKLLACYDEILRLLPEDHIIIDFLVVDSDEVRIKRALLLDRRGEEEKAAADFHFIQKEKYGSDYAAELRARIPEKYRLSQEAAL